MPGKIYNKKTGKLALDAGQDANGPYIVFENGMRLYSYASAITKNVTTTTAPVGSLVITSNATGRGKMFVSDGTKLQLIVATSEV